MSNCLSQEQKVRMKCHCCQAQQWCMVPALWSCDPGLHPRYPVWVLVCIHLQIPAAAASWALGTSASKKFHPKVRNHGEGLLLVESGYYRFHI